MAKSKFTTDGNKAIKLNWVIKILDDCKNVDSNRAYKVIAIAVDESLAIIVPFSDVKDIIFTGTRHRSSVYKKIKTSISLYSKVEMYGAHSDNLEKQDKIKEENQNKNLEKEEKIQALGLGGKLEEVLLDIIKDYEVKLHDDMIKRFEYSLEKLGLEGVFYKCEFKEMSMSDISKVSIKSIGNQGWSFCFEVNGKYYFGKTIKSLEDRLEGHVSSCFNFYLYNKGHYKSSFEIIENGNYRIDSVMDCYDEEQLHDMVLKTS